MAGEPMIKLDPGGKAPILSYNVPEPTSYPGRNYINLELPASYWKPAVAAPASPASAPHILYAPESRPAAAAVSSRSATPGLPALVTSEVYQLSGSGAQSSQVTPGLAALNQDTLDIIRAAGKEPLVYRNLFGALDVRLLPQRNGGGEGNGTSGGDPTVIYLSIASPVNGATFTGQATGVAVNVSGTTVESGLANVASVDVQIGSDPFQPAAPAANNDWSTWSYTGLVKASGRVTITARATDTSGKAQLTRTRSVIISVALTVPPSPDKTPPSVAIMSPVDGTIQSGFSNLLAINVSGSATDDTGVKLVEITVDRNTGGYKAAQPKQPGDWSSWNQTVQITSMGPHSITARATDNGGNQMESTITITVSDKPVVIPKTVRLLLVESYYMSSFLGNYGAGRTLKTFTLLPGEKTKISVKSWTKTQTDAKQASSILDSFTQESASDFEQSTSQEQSFKDNYDESFKYSVSGEASASWGWGSAKIDATASGGTNSAREEFGKNLVSAVQKHAAKASAKRDVQINTSYEVTQETGQETSVEREIANINVSRTLNFVFRQMNQEYVTLLHLVDLRVGFFMVQTVNGNDVTTYREVTMPQLNALLADVIVDSRQKEVRDAIVAQCSNIWDYKDDHHSFVEEKELLGDDGQPVLNSAYLRVKRDDPPSTYKDPVTGSEFSVAGMIIAMTKNVLRTEGVIVEAILGDGDALDEYSHGLQEQAIIAKKMANDAADAANARNRLANAIIEGEKDKEAQIFAQVYPPQPVADVVVVGKSPGEGGPDGHKAPSQ